MGKVRMECMCGVTGVKHTCSIYFSSVSGQWVALALVIKNVVNE